MLELLKFIHFASFSLAIGAGAANLIAGRRLSALPPEVMPRIGTYRLTLGKVQTVSLVLLWLTGFGMISYGPGWEVFSDPWFQLKFAFVLVLTAFSVAANLAVIRASRAGGPPDPQRMKWLGIGSHVTALVIVGLAVIAFS